MPEETKNDALEQDAAPAVKAPWVQIAGLWKNVSKDGTKYLSGNLGNGRLIAYPNKKKAPDSKEPDYRLYIVDNPRPAKKDESDDAKSEDFAE
jgi:hypothetical protein